MNQTRLSIWWGILFLLLKIWLLLDKSGWETMKPSTCLWTQIWASATWKISKVGDMAKWDKQPCHCCAIQSDDLPHKCTWFCTNENDVCYHKTFLSSNNSAEVQMHYNLLQSTLDEQHQSYEKLDCCCQWSLMRSQSSSKWRKSKWESIYFDVEAENVTYATSSKSDDHQQTSNQKHGCDNCYAMWMTATTTWSLHEWVWKFGDFIWHCVMAKKWVLQSIPVLA